ncbi:type II toxin-antitoxin system PemK/MazF family toxin [Janthinobacterium sp.]|uniref:type II toxin-antitoxin system PemK/MazF family toxin n=1 Tax=Janthinobacterium sp. TaxID=1871054 RepID=UPI002589922E|nr:type II toxin-antitoxin system PemK/MazF family toxin [Janthinobacterium sp.]MCX7292078.1 type II toxin-antitoxin system PemK/MazF family toxin [Janthinobacterium sp.]
MQTIVVEYHESVTKDMAESEQIFLGKEIFENFDEALLPAEEDFKVFCVKKFKDIKNHHWEVKSANRTSKLGVVPVTFCVLLTRNSHVADVYLDTVLKVGGAKPSKLLRPGTLVEVDYGYIQKVAHGDGGIRNNNLYSDTVQHGEMHKRRLAVVVKVTGKGIQVAPVTSNEDNEGDKTCFELTRETLDKLSFYGPTKLRSWVICSMLETVSPQRILSPSSFFMVRDRRRSGRDPNYKEAISTQEMQLLQTALVHAVGVTDYEEIKRRLSDRNQECVSLRTTASRVQDLEKKIIELESQNKYLTIVEELAIGWSNQMGYSLEHHVNELSQIYAAIAQEAVDKESELA